VTPGARTLLRLAASAVLLALVLWQFGAGQVWGDIRAASALWVALAVGALALQIPLSAWRWQVTAHALGVPVGRKTALREYGLSVLVNTFLPGGVLGDLGRVLRMRGAAAWQAVAASVVIERLVGQIAMTCAAMAGVALWWGPMAGGLALLACLVVVGITVGMGRFLPRIRSSLHAGLFARAVWPSQLALSLAILACNLFGFWAAARAVGVALPPQAALMVLPLTLLVMLVPLSLNGWGLREGAAAVLWPLVGTAPELAVAASVIFGIAVALAALIGALPVVLYPATPPIQDAS
jgi:glycosyltransferase 2 family protein